MSRRRYFEEQRSGNGAIYHCVKTEIEPGDKIRLFNLMNKVKSDTISQDKINSVLNQLREGTAFNIHTQSPVSFSFSSTSTGYEPMSIRITGEEYGVIKGQGHTTRDFGESGGKRNAGGGSGETNTGVVFQGGISDYSEGSGTGGSTNGSGKGGGGYGGGGGGVRYSMVYAGAGGDGTVLIRGRRYKS